ncbi:phospho-2-dehydro-3-deoxyheptonate aldolase [Striga asiatica]|uniref:Phospho-2-dehydro-3-deoxyheptonate aldolase n=1 Tax=Striga asiatica TaxID=4170 RepID=A0A5A7PH17_STRAF|nr:phospho-2-dehydro-3-deoxyheptonate aldolase [Striga asiatica]
MTVLQAVGALAGLLMRCQRLVLCRSNPQPATHFSSSSLEIVAVSIRLSPHHHPVSLLRYRDSPHRRVSRPSLSSRRAAAVYFRRAPPSLAVADQSGHLPVDPRSFLR